MNKDFTPYLPYVNVKDGMARVINNLPLYMRLLGKFKGRELANDLKKAVENGDKDKIIYSAHAIKGTCANLGFPIVCKVAGEIEELAKKNEGVAHLTLELDKEIENLMDTIDKLSKELS